MSHQEEFFLDGGLDFGSILGPSSSSGQNNPSTLNFTTPLSVLNSFTPHGSIIGGFDNTLIDEEEKMSDVEDFSHYHSNNNNDFISLDDDDLTSPTDSNPNFTRLAAIDGDMHITGLNRSTRQKHNLKNTTKDTHPHSKLDDDDDIWSDSDNDNDHEGDDKDNNSNTMNDNNPSKSNDDDDVANMRIHTTIDDLMRPPGLPSFSIIKPLAGQLMSQNNNTNGKSNKVRQTVRFSARNVERFFSTEDPAAKSNIYAGEPGLEPPSTYIGVPMELFKGLWEPSVKVNLLRTGTSTIKFDSNKRMVTTCLQHDEFSSIPPLQPSSNTGFDESCDVGVFDLTVMVKLKANKMRRWDRYLNRVHQRQELISKELELIESQLEDLRADKETQKTPAKGDVPSPQYNEAQLQQQRQIVLSKQLFDITEKQQNIIIGGGPANAGIGIGHYRLMQTIGVQPPPDVLPTAYNTTLSIVAPLPTVPSTLPFNSVQPTNDSFILSFSHFPSVPLKEYDGENGLNGEKGPKRSYFEQVLLSQKPRGHCETICAVLEQRRQQQFQLGMANTTATVSKPLGLALGKSQNQQNINQNQNIGQNNNNNNNGNNNGQNTLSSDFGGLYGSLLFNPDLQSQIDITIPLPMSRVLEANSKDREKMKFSYYYFNHYGSPSLAKTTSTSSPPLSITNLDNTSLLSNLAQLYRLDRLAFYTLTWPSSSKKPSKTEENLILKDQIETLLNRFTPTQQSPSLTNTFLSSSCPVVRVGPIFQPEKTSYRSQQHILTALSFSQQEQKYSNNSNSNSNNNNNNINNISTHPNPLITNPHSFLTPAPKRPLMQDISQLSHDDILYHNGHLESGESMTLLDASFDFDLANYSSENLFGDLDLLSRGSALDRDESDMGEFSDVGEDEEGPGETNMGILGPKGTFSSSLGSLTPKILSRANSTNVLQTPSLMSKPSLRDFNLFDAPVVGVEGSGGAGGENRGSYLGSFGLAPTTPSLSALIPSFATPSTTRPPSPQHQAGQGQFGTGLLGQMQQQGFQQQGSQGSMFFGQNQQNQQNQQINNPNQQNPPNPNNQNNQNPNNPNMNPLQGSMPGGPLGGPQKRPLPNDPSQQNKPNPPGPPGSYSNNPSNNNNQNNNNNPNNPNNQPIFNNGPNNQQGGFGNNNQQNRGGFNGPNGPNNQGNNFNRGPPGPNQQNQPPNQQNQQQNQPPQGPNQQQRPPNQQQQQQQQGPQGYQGGNQQQQRPPPQQQQGQQQQQGPPNQLQQQQNRPPQQGGPGGPGGSQQQGGIQAPPRPSAFVPNNNGPNGPINTNNNGPNFNNNNNNQHRGPFNPNQQQNRGPPQQQQQGNYQNNNMNRR